MKSRFDKLYEEVMNEGIFGDVKNDVVHDIKDMGQYAKDITTYGYKHLTGTTDDYNIADKKINTWFNAVQRNEVDKVKNMIETGFPVNTLFPAYDKSYPYTHGMEEHKTALAIAKELNHSYEFDKKHGIDRKPMSKDYNEMIDLLVKNGAK